ncbi:uncharacterized protein LOC111001680 [Pieris rapae]|uniref:uncharacterized protein LOC111001680 n=1 Tax=Pieris rapae TaxID=64459 RepID=UPI001E27C5E4|nr:uncharacterized protein LOC111001680 [Pieris rapae]
MNHRKTDFVTRFRLLNSQDNSEEIVWSCSSSSDNENDGGKMNSIQDRKHSKTRKRKASKMMFTNDICNLHLTISDTSQESQGNYNTSPILKPRQSKSISNFKRNHSPPLYSKIKGSSSPILQPITDERRSKSPVLVSKLKENTSEVCKKLFNSNVTNQCSVKKRCISPIVCKRNSEGPTLISTKFVYKSDNNQNKTALVEKIKSYFQRSLSTESLSQNSISECSTPKNSSKTSDEVEIIDFTQGLPMPVKHEGFLLTTHSAEKNKKVKYKKDGLAYRLENLLKKQNANISLWQHEQYLANNSNFIMPKGVCAVFRIKKVNFKFGCFLLLAINDKDEVFIILINTLYVKEKIDSDVILKIYEPYKVLDFNDKCKLIVNVCKYVCESFIL